MWDKSHEQQSYWWWGEEPQRTELQGDTLPAINNILSILPQFNICSY